MTINHAETMKITLKSAGDLLQEFEGMEPGVRQTAIRGAVMEIRWILDNDLFAERWKRVFDLTGASWRTLRLYPV